MSQCQRGQACMLLRTLRTIPAGTLAPVKFNNVNKSETRRQMKEGPGSLGWSWGNNTVRQPHFTETETRSSVRRQTADLCESLHLADFCSYSYKSASVVTRWREHAFTLKKKKRKKKQSSYVHLGDNKDSPRAFKKRWTHGVCMSADTVGIPLLQASVDRMDCSTDTEK